MPTNQPSDKQILLQVGDGPDGITIYTSDDESIHSWVENGVFVEVSTFSGTCRMGPMLSSIAQQLKDLLK
jgi:hypothetical protein